MNAEFQWWLLILGIVIGGALVYLVLAELQGDPAADDEPLGPRPDDDLPPDRTDPSRPLAWEEPEPPDADLRVAGVDGGGAGQRGD